VRVQGTAGLEWPLALELSDAELEGRLFPLPRPSNIERPLPDWSVVHEELKARRRTGVTLQLLWLEYKERHTDGLQYSQFCELYRRWRGGLDRVLRQEHRAGEKVFVDFTGQTVPVVASWSRPRSALRPWLRSHLHDPASPHR
jgi:transposase